MALWFLKLSAVLKGALDAQAEVERAVTADEKRLAQQKLTRFMFTAYRLRDERERAVKLARLLAA